MVFDFKAYLARLTPDVSYNITRLTGGIVNATVRATKTASGNTDTCFPGHDSLILKYAPPYISGVGESAPMSTFRQTIEARALALFQPTNTPSLHQIITSSGVLVPELLHWDPENKVLILSDLGVLPNLSDVFNALGGHNPNSPPPTTTNVSQLPSTLRDLSSSETEYFHKIGRKLGSFFASLHSQQTITQIKTTTPPNHLFNPEISNIVLTHAIKPIRDHLSLFPHLIDKTESDTLYSAIETDFLRPSQDAEQSFVLGDCWTSAVLVDHDQTNPKVGVIDWEFASIGRGINGDMSQIMAHLELFRTAADHLRPASDAVAFVHALDAIVDGLTTSYREMSLTREEIHVPDPRSLDATVMRSAFLAHGAEIIDSAFWKVWKCDGDESCLREQEKHTDLKQECSLIRKMVERGIWFLRRAGRDNEDFCSSRNWQIIEDENTRMKGMGRSWLIDLFLKG